jgi:hypothetical protein
VITIHDCLSFFPLITAREKKTDLWSGDVWKVIATLIKYRPDLEIFTVAARPTGLGIITGLDPASTILNDNYDRIIAEFMPQELPEDFSETRRHMRAVDSDCDIVRDRLALRRGRQAA